MSGDLHDPKRDHLHTWLGEREPSETARKTRAALILVGMVCVTLVLISFACAWSIR